MTAPKMKFVDYDAVIADIESQIADLNTALKAIKRIRQLGVGIGTTVRDVPSPSSGIDTPTLSENDEIRSDAFFRLTIAEAAVKYLRRWAGRKPQPTKAIIDALARGGLKGKGYQTVYKTLVRRSREKSDVVNVHGDWGLQEWYQPQASTDAARQE